ncbi:hypothetical protein AB0G81_06610 [Streptomyces asoensis]|uniref:hypothetical protein n=1 Tax=Streptomyces asoensis TaxID=249586 RepID=UPI00340507ED
MATPVSFVLLLLLLLLRRRSRAWLGYFTYSGRRASVSPWFLGGVVLGTSVFFLRKRNEGGGQIAEAIGTQLAGAAAMERRGLDELRKAVLPAPTQATIRQQVATCLARQGSRC